MRLSCLQLRVCQEDGRDDDAAERVNAGQRVKVVALHTWHFNLVDSGDVDDEPSPAAAKASAPGGSSLQKAKGLLSQPGSLSGGGGGGGGGRAGASGPAASSSSSSSKPPPKKASAAPVNAEDSFERELAAELESEDAAAYSMGFESDSPPRM